MARFLRFPEFSFSQFLVLSFLSSSCSLDFYNFLFFPNSGFRIFSFFEISRFIKLSFVRFPVFSLLSIIVFSWFSLFSFYNFIVFLFSEKCILSWFTVPPLYRSLCLSLVLSFSISFSLSSLLGAPSRSHCLYIKLSLFLPFSILRCLLFLFL